MVYWSRKGLTFVGLCCFAFVSISYFVTIDRRSSTFTFLMAVKERVDKDVCPGVLRYMTSGTWKSRDITSREKNEIDKFVKEGLHLLPNSSNYERPDGKCGNLSYPNNEHTKWFRVLCNPDGPTPCCFKSMCVKKTVDECKGPFNYDLRSSFHAEYATWKPLDKRCSVKLFNSESACSLLKDSTIFIAGDSIMRGVYIALIQILSGDLQTGAFKKNTPKEGKKKCAGMYMYHYKTCSDPYLDHSPSLCNGSLKIYYTFYGPVGKPFIHEALKLKGKKKSMIFLGVGLWDHYDYNKVINTYLRPLLPVLRNLSNYSYWPKILWASAHQLGIWRYPYVKTASNIYGKLFNDKMAAYLSNFSVPVFDTFNLTEGVMSMDGTHYGQGVNLLKAQLYFNYMQELKDRKLW